MDGQAVGLVGDMQETQALGRMLGLSLQGKSQSSTLTSVDITALSPCLQPPVIPLLKGLGRQLVFQGRTGAQAAFHCWHLD